MPVRRRHSYARGTVDRRRTTWARSSGLITNASAATYSTTDLLAAFKAAGGTTFGTTVARIHLRLSVVSATVTADQFGIGIIKGQDTDVGVTVAGAPAPTTHPYEDWLYWSIYTANVGSGSGAGYFLGGTGSSELIDVKAKRKLEDLDECLNLAYNTTVAGTFPQQIWYSSSVLLMLP